MAWLLVGSCFGGVGAEAPSVLDAGRAARPVPIPPRRKASFTARVATGHSQPIVLPFLQPHETTTIVESKNAAVEEAGTDVRVAIHSHLGMASWGNATAYIGRVCPESCRLVKNMLWLAGGVAGALRRPRVHLDGTMQIVGIVRRE